MTQSLSCWNHHKSILRSQVVISVWSLWETFEIIFHLQTLSQSDYREKNYIWIVSEALTPSKGIGFGFRKYRINIKFVSFIHFKSLNHYTESIKIYLERKGKNNIWSLNHDLLSFIKQVFLNWANQNIHC